MRCNKKAKYLKIVNWKNVGINISLILVSLVLLTVSIVLMCEFAELKGWFVPKVAGFVSWNCLMMIIIYHMADMVKPWFDVYVVKRGKLYKCDNKASENVYLVLGIVLALFIFLTVIGIPIVAGIESIDCLTVMPFLMLGLLLLFSLVIK